MAKSKSEQLFETYLQRLGVDLDYEPDLGGERPKRPDRGLKERAETIRL